MSTTTTPARILSRHVDDCAHLIQVTDEQRAHFQREGWLVIKGVTRPDCIQPLQAEILEVLAARNLPDSYLAQAREYLAGGYLDGWVNSTHLRRMAEAFLGGPGHVYLPFTAVKGPGQGAFTFHQDNNYTRLDGPGAAIGVNCWTALVPIREANGCLRIVPRSHVSGTVEAVASEECPGHRRTVATPTSWVDVEMEPGDTCIFHRLTVHGSGPNRTDQARVGYAVQFYHHDTRWLNTDDQTWHLLRETERFCTGPVAHLSDRAQQGE